MQCICRINVIHFQTQLVPTRDEHGSGLKPILVGSDWNFLEIGGSGLDRTEKIFVFWCDYSNHIKNVSCNV